MVYVLLTDGFEEIEAIEPIDIMRRCGIEVETVGVDSLYVCGSHGISVKADILINDVNTNDMELLMLPGGPGHTGLSENSTVEFLLNYANEHKIYIAAICAAPSIIGKMGFLNGRCAVCFPGYEKHLTGAKICSSKVVCDGKFITGRGAGAASEFGFMLASILKDDATANKIREMMQY